MAVTQDRALAPSVLYDRYYYTVSAARARVRLEWANPLAANVVQPLTGGYLLSSWDATDPEVLYCIVAGEIGLVEGEYFKYSISRMQSGEVGMTQFEMSAVCDGPEFDVELWGCVNRD